MTPSDKQIDTATDAYLKARGWDDATILQHSATRIEVRERMAAALKAVWAQSEASDVQEPQ